MSCSDNIDLKQGFINTFGKLYNHAKLTGNPNAELYKPSLDNYSDKILNNFDGFMNNVSSNIDLDNYNGNEDIVENKDNIFIIDNKTNNVYENCAISSGIPWFSTNNKFNKCEIPNNIRLDDNNVLKMSDDKKSINYNFKSNKKNAGFCSHYKNIKKAYCENSWYDWLIVPNYYLGNTYFKDIGKYRENDVYKCYKPCDGDYIPFKNNRNEMSCIPRNLYSNGALINKYKYSALGLINLIGNITTINNKYNKIGNNNLTFINYYLIFVHKHNMNIDSNIYETNSIYNNIINTNNKEQFNLFISNINDIENEFINCIKNQIIDIDNFDNSLNQNYNSGLNIFSYKSTEFQEKTNDLISLNGLEFNNILIDPILIHIWILANIYIPYTKDELIKLTTADPKTNPITNTELYDLLLTNNFDKDKTKNINIAIRLKNIFFRAVNVCYNNKTIFSANIINKTKKALQNKELINLILEKEFYINQDYKNINFKNKNNLTNFLSDLTLLDNFKEIYYYDDVELNEMVYSINNKNEIVKNLIGDFGMKNDENDINGENNRFKYLFSIEYLEASNTCKLNEIYNPLTGLCNPRPPKIENIKEEDGIDNIDDEFKIPQMKYLLTLFIQVIFVVIIVYIIYLFYNIFGETIIASINWIYENSNSLINDVNIKSLNRKINANATDISNDNIIYMKKILDIELQQERQNFENMKSKIDTIENYIREHKLDESEDDDEEEDDEEEDDSIFIPLKI